MIFQTGTIDQYVIQKNQHKLPKEWFQDFIHDTLESGRGIGEPKRHDSELIVPMMSFESCFEFTRGIHSHLMVS
jgi:hypothetical protein